MKWGWSTIWNSFRFQVSKFQVESSHKEFINFLYMAKGSNGEVRSQAYVALDLGYISQAECDDLIRRCETLSRRLYNFIEYLKRTPFEGPKLREPGPVWYLNEPET